MNKAKWVAAALGLAVWAVALPSFADGPATSGALQLGLGFRYGAELNDGDFNPWGNGLGVELGYTLPVLNVYAGGNVEYFFGSSVDTVLGKIDGNLWQATVEGGYDFGLGDHVVLRPKLGFGVANVTTEACFPDCVKDTKSEGVIAPGATLMLILVGFQAAVDVRYDIVTSSPSSKALIFSLGIGF